MHDCLLKGPLYPYDISCLAAEVLDAFTAIHEMGDTHGNIVPRSISRTPRGTGNFRYTITDLGLGAIIPIIHGDAVDTTNPALSPPELLRGETATPPSDIFMLGQLCYTLLAQGHPYGDADHAEALRKHEAGELPPLHELVIGCPPELSQWMSKMTAPKIADRYQTAFEAAQDLPKFANPHLSDNTAKQGLSPTPPKTGPALIVPSTPANITTSHQALASTARISDSQALESTVTDTQALASTSATQENTTTSITPSAQPVNSATQHLASSTLNNPTNELQNEAPQNEKGKMGLIIGILVAVLLTTCVFIFIPDKKDDNSAENNTEEDNTKENTNPSNPQTNNANDENLTFEFVGGKHLVKEYYSLDTNHPEIYKLSEGASDWMVFKQPPINNPVRSAKGTLLGTPSNIGKISATQTAPHKIKFQVTTADEKTPVIVIPKLHSTSQKRNKLKAGVGWKFPINTPSDNSKAINIEFYTLGRNIATTINLLHADGRVVSSKTYVSSGKNAKIIHLYKVQIKLANYKPSTTYMIHQQVKSLHKPFSIFAPLALSAKIE